MLCIWKLSYIVINVILSLTDKKIFSDIRRACMRIIYTNVKNVITNLKQEVLSIDM